MLRGGSGFALLSVAVEAVEEVVAARNACVSGVPVRAPDVHTRTVGRDDTAGFVMALIRERSADWNAANNISTRPTVFFFRKKNKFPHLCLFG